MTAPAEFILDRTGPTDGLFPFVCSKVGFYNHPYQPQSEGLPMLNQKSPRLNGYDYRSVGMYFVTICTHARSFLFGDVVNGTMVLSLMGQRAAECWAEIPTHFVGVGIDGFVVMPNHVHGIIEIKPLEGSQSTHRGSKSSSVGRDATCCVSTNDSPPSQARPHVEAGSLGAIVRAYKSAVTRQIRQAIQKPEIFVWQRRYHDHIIRNDADLNRIREYVQNNPVHWQEDRYYAP